MMIPFDGDRKPVAGCLESLLLEALSENFSRLLPCVEAFRQCVDSGEWTKTRDHKMRLRSVIAAGHADDPNLSLRFAVQPGKQIIDLTHQCMTGIVEFLLHFESWVNQQRQQKFR